MEAWTARCRKPLFYECRVMPHNEVFSEVQRARIGIIPLPALPKYLNNIPQKLFEYMALELPVVLSDLLRADLL